MMSSGDKTTESLHEWLLNKADNVIFKDQHSWGYIKTFAEEAVRKLEEVYGDDSSARKNKFNIPDSIRRMGKVGTSFELQKLLLVAHKTNLFLYSFVFALF